MKAFMIKPNKEQYIETIRNGDDSQYKKNVVLNFNGIFEIVYNYKANDRYNEC